MTSVLSVSKFANIAIICSPWKEKTVTTRGNTNKTMDVSVQTLHSSETLTSVHQRLLRCFVFVFTLRCPSGFQSRSAQKPLCSIFVHRLPLSTLRVISIGRFLKLQSHLRQWAPFALMSLFRANRSKSCIWTWNSPQSCTSSTESLLFYNAGRYNERNEHD